MNFYLIILLIFENFILFLFVNSIIVHRRYNCNAVIQANFRQRHYLFVEERTILDLYEWLKILHSFVQPIKQLINRPYFLHTFYLSWECNPFIVEMDLIFIMYSLLSLTINFKFCQLILPLQEDSYFHYFVLIKHFTILSLLSFFSFNPWS